MSDLLFSCLGELFVPLSSHVLPSFSGIFCVQSKFVPQGGQRGQTWTSGSEISPPHTAQLVHELLHVPAPLNLHFFWRYWGKDPAFLLLTAFRLAGILSVTTHCSFWFPFAQTFYWSITKDPIILSSFTCVLFQPLINSGMLYLSLPPKAKTCSFTCFYQVMVLSCTLKTINLTKSVVIFSYDLCQHLPLKINSFS